MKLSVFWITICFVVGIGAGEVYAQKSLARQKEEYIQGNRNPEFLKQYIQALKSERQVESLGEVVDCYLMSLPLEKRYAGENLEDFTEYVGRVDAKSLIDVVVNWEKLSFMEKHAAAIVNKVNDVCRAAISQAGAEKRKLDCSQLQAGFKKSKIPVSDIVRSIIDMWQFQMNKNIDGMIQVFTQMVGKIDVTLEKSSSYFVEVSVLGNMLNYILEECDSLQCRKMYGVLADVLEKKGQKGIFGSFVNYKNNFEGKCMMIEMGEE